MARRFTLASSPNGAASPSPPRRIARPPAPRALPCLGARGTRRPSGGHLSPRGRLVLTICSQLAHVQGVYQGVLFKMRRTVCGSRCLAGGARSTIAWQASLALRGAPPVTQTERPGTGFAFPPFPLQVRKRRGHVEYHQRHLQGQPERPWRP